MTEKSYWWLNSFSNLKERQLISRQKRPPNNIFL